MIIQTNTKHKMKKIFFLTILGLSFLTLLGQKTTSPQSGQSLDGLNTKKQLFEYLRSKIIAFGHEIKDVIVHENVCLLVIYDNDGGMVEQHISECDGNGISWEIRDKKLRIQISSKSNGYADYYSPPPGEQGGGPRIFTRCLFSLSKISGESNFQMNIANAYKKLIKLCGGNPSID